MEPIEQRSIEARDAWCESAITPRQFGVDSRRLRQPHQRSGETGILERRYEAVDRLDARLAALLEARDICQLELEGAEVVTRRKMRGGDEVVDVGVAASAERLEPLGQIDHLAGQQRIVKRQHRGAVGHRVDAELKGKQHPHELRQHTLYFEEVLRFFCNFRHRREMIVAKTGARMQFAFATLGLRPCRGRNFDSLTWRLATDLQ